MVKDITDRFSLTKIDHDELLANFSLRYGTCWRVSNDQITFPAHEHFKIKVKTRHGQIDKIWSGDAMEDQELDELLEQLKDDDGATEFGAEILFAQRPVLGAFRFKELPLQILPPPAEAPQLSWADKPFVLEFPIRCSQTPEIRHLRRRKNAVKWAWILNALINGSIKPNGLYYRQMWAIKAPDVTLAIWAQESYNVPGFDGFRANLSEHGDRLPLVSADACFGKIAEKQKKLPIDEFYLPDNIDTLLATYLNLDPTRQRRFVRSAAAIQIARELWDVSKSSCLIVCVQAIETLIDSPPAIPCPTCRKNTGPGPTKLFRDFVEKYCPTSDRDRKYIEELYRVRSALAHGKYLLQLDEAPWSIDVGSMIASYHEPDTCRVAITAAKDGLRNWLCDGSIH